MTIFWLFILAACGVLLAVEAQIAAMEQQWRDDESGPYKPWWDDGKA